MDDEGRLCEEVAHVRVEGRGEFVVVVGLGGDAEGGRGEDVLGGGWR